VGHLKRRAICNECEQTRTRRRRRRGRQRSDQLVGDSRGGIRFRGACLNPSCLPALTPGNEHCSERRALPRGWMHDGMIPHANGAYPDQELHLICDNYATHKTPEVKTWLAANPPVRNTWHSSSRSPVRIIQRQAIGRGIFTSVRDLTTKIRAFVTGWNNRATPFVWTKTPDQILEKATLKTTSHTNH
jgi:hypothetical protein